ncbi:hypothetical protein BJ742DRAFT_831428 [Cladochytrium replicatum]|nr:hypothetical protein BJ742DRAFT_831428 [Cladochytrium replicatum]
MRCLSISVLVKLFRHGFGGVSTEVPKPIASDGSCEKMRARARSFNVSNEHPETQDTSTHHHGRWGLGDKVGLDTIDSCLHLSGTCLGVGDDLFDLVDRRIFMYIPEDTFTVPADTGAPISLSMGISTPVNMLLST